MRWLLGAVVGFLALVGIIASATHYLQEPYNPGFREYPVIVALHVVLGGVYLALAPFQFVKRIRSRHPGYHRWVGRMLVSIGLVVGATALFMGLVIPFSGWIERAYIGLFGTFFLLALIQGFLHVRAKRVALHREWMIRAFAIGLAVATMHLIFVPAIIVVADPTQSQLQALSAASFLVAFVVHASVAEAWIRLTRKRRVPEASGAKAAYEPIPGRG
ncbi:MAG: putative rane protein [Rubrobacteraceae bacterium]|nr:putative rane protein [Rubrobacteraceae bacterium]